MGWMRTGERRVSKCQISGNADADVYKSAQVYGGRNDSVHHFQRRLRQRVVHFEYLRLTRESHGEYGHALQYASHPPNFHVSRNALSNAFDSCLIERLIRYKDHY